MHFILIKGRCLCIDDLVYVNKLVIGPHTRSMASRSSFITSSIPHVLLHPPAAARTAVAVVWSVGSWRASPDAATTRSSAQMALPHNAGQTYGCRQLVGRICSDAVIVQPPVVVLVLVRVVVVVCSEIGQWLPDRVC